MAAIAKLFVLDQLNNLVVYLYYNIHVSIVQDKMEEDGN